MDVDYLVEKIPNLRIFPDDEGKMNRSLMDMGGKLLLVSQFTLLGDTHRGRRPGFDRAAHPDQARQLYDSAITNFREKWGRFKQASLGRTCWFH